jgi:hypothetical protein
MQIDIENHFHIITAKAYLAFRFNFDDSKTIEKISAGNCGDLVRYEMGKT